MSPSVSSLAYQICEARWLSALAQMLEAAVMVPSAVKLTAPTVAATPSAASFGLGVAAVEVPAAVWRDTS